METAFHIKSTLLFRGYCLLFVCSFIIAIVFEQPAFYAIPFVALMVPIVIARPSFMFLLLLITLPLSMEYQVTPSLGTDFPDEIMMWMTTGVFILLVIAQPGIIKKQFYRHPLFYLLMLHIAWIFMSAIFAQEPLLSIKYFLAKTWYIIPFVFFIQVFLEERRSFLWIILCLVIPMVLVVLQSVYRHFFFGFKFESINKTVIPFFRNHVNYAAMLACMFPLILALHYHCRSLRWQRVIKIFIFVFLCGIILSYSRGAWLALVSGGVVYLCTKWKMIRGLLLSLTLLIVGSFAWMGHQNKYLDFRPDFNKTIFHTDFSQHMSATYHFRDLSTAERFYRWIAAIRLSGDHSLTGVGPNNFYSNYKPYAVSAYKTWVSRNTEHSTVHNYFILLLCEQGIPGLLFFVTLLFASFLYAEKIYHRSGGIKKTASITIGCILGIITTLNFLSDLVETDKIGSLFFISLGILIWLDIRTSLLHQGHPEGHSPTY